LLAPPCQGELRENSSAVQEQCESTSVPEETASIITAMKSIEEDTMSLTMANDGKNSDPSSAFGLWPPAETNVPFPLAPLIALASIVVLLWT
jgi:hypothetical protein